MATNETDASHWRQHYRADRDLAVVDLFLLRGNGLGVLACCRERSAHQKLVALTNYAYAQVHQRCLALGADAVFDKPNELDEFTGFGRGLCNARPSPPKPWLAAPQRLSAAASAWPAPAGG